MWLLLKAEYSYWRTGLTMLLLPYCTLLVVVFHWGWESVERDLAGMTNIGLIGLIIFTSARVAVQRADKIERLYAMLPMSCSSLGAVRALFIPSVWFAQLTMIVAAWVVFRYDTLALDGVERLAALTGVVLAINAYLLLQREVAAMEWKTATQILVHLGFGIVSVGGILLLVMMFGQFHDMNPGSLSFKLFGGLAERIPVEGARWGASLSGALTWIILGLLLTLLDLAFFRIRRSRLV